MGNFPAQIPYKIYFWKYERNVPYGPKTNPVEPWKVIISSNIHLCKKPIKFV